MSTTDYPKQAADNIVTILTQPPTVTPSLQAGDPVRNALLDIATQLKQAQEILEPH